MIGPGNVAGLHVVGQGFDRSQELSLFDGKGLDLEDDRRFPLETAERFEQRQGILAARDTDGDTVAGANHIEFVDGLAGLAHQAFFDIGARQEDSPGSPDPAASFHFGMKF